MITDKRIFLASIKSIYSKIDSSINRRKPSDFQRLVEDAGLIYFP